jgi:hypothetical protein
VFRNKLNRDDKLLLAFDARVLSEVLKDVGQRCVRSPEGDHVEEEVEILGSPGFWECELNGLGASDNEIFRCGAERSEELEQIGLLGLGNHAAFQWGSMALVKR